ncbi:acyltransferase [Aquitalea aquatica]|uniref:Acyltransferase n=1 Tax=Aquitalea aquatica TaxID=3044273 RepID=A0A838Y284_9NEIS|nr:acyltransferase [Aquitalea magnusonii]MBA4707392.1 acyltransferase [Aquitalea magnusonii]
MANISIFGSGNEIHSKTDIDDQPNLSIQTKGNNNKIVIGHGCELNGLTIQIESSGNILSIGNSCRIKGRFIMKVTDKNQISIGNNCTMGGANLICGEGSSIFIGTDCMLSWGIEIRSTDSHAIFQSSDGKRINPAADIRVENHVWIGAHCTILKGSHIGSDCVVGIHSLVCNSFPDGGQIIAGIPARSIRQGINWDRRLLG